MLYSTFKIFGLFLIDGINKSLSRKATLKYEFHICLNETKDRC